ADLRADGDALRVRKRPYAHLWREAEHAAERGLPRAGLRRGDVRARMPPGRARSAARARSTGAANAEPRRPRPGRRPAVLVEEPARVLQARPAALGPAGRRAGALRGAGATRRRAREPDLVRRRWAALVCVGPDRLRRARNGR